LSKIKSKNIPEKSYSSKSKTELTFEINFKVKSKSTRRQVINRKKNVLR